MAQFKEFSLTKQNPRHGTDNKKENHFKFILPYVNQEHYRESEFLFKHRFLTLL